VRLTFAGTRGNIPIRSRLHWRHSTLVVEERGQRLVVDCGGDWLGRIGRLHPTAILVTHAHDDHAAGLKRGAPCGVYATEAAWRALASWPLATRCVIPTGCNVMVAGLIVEAWSVHHSLVAPAVGFRISGGGVRIFYVPDVADLPRPAAALRNVDLYVGDGATLMRPLTRARGRVLIGHASIHAQLRWCQHAGVREAIFTHCGSGIVRADAGEVAERVAAIGREHGVIACVAHDGLVKVVRPRAPAPVR
jgi:ribonuclease BN (tRNA processing enzyme)